MDTIGIMVGGGTAAMPRKIIKGTAGRPDTGLDRRVTVLFTSELAEQMERIAARKGQTLSTYVRFGMERIVAQEREEER